MNTDPNVCPTCGGWKFAVDDECEFCQASQLGIDALFPAPEPLDARLLMNAIVGLCKGNCK